MGFKPCLTACAPRAARYSPARARLKLDARAFVVPRHADDRRVVAIHRVLDGEDGVHVILLAERLALKHQIVGLRQVDHVEPVRHDRVRARLDLHALHVARGARQAVALRQPEADRLPAEAVHAGEQAPDVAADLLAIAEVLLSRDAAADDRPARGPVHRLNKHALHVFHVDMLPSQLPELDAVRDEERDGHGRAGVLRRIAPELAQKRALIAVHAAKAHLERHVRDAPTLPAQPHRRAREPQAANVLRDGLPGMLAEEAVGVPGRKQRRARQLRHGDFLIQMRLDIVLHALDGENLIVHRAHLPMG